MINALIPLLLSLFTVVFCLIVIASVFLIGTIRWKRSHRQIRPLKEQKIFSHGQIEQVSPKRTQEQHAYLLKWRTEPYVLSEIPVNPSLSENEQRARRERELSFRSYMAFLAILRDLTGGGTGPHEEERRQAQQDRITLFKEGMIHTCRDGACTGLSCTVCEIFQCEQVFRVQGRKAQSMVCLSCRTLQSKLITLHICDDGMCEGMLCRTCGRLRCREYFRKNPRKPQHRINQCVECISPLDAQFYEENFAYYEAQRKEHRKLRQARLKDAKEGSAHTVTAQEWNALKASYENHCLCCGRKEPAITLTQDHIIPVSAGGRHHIENIQPLCLHCNAQKNAQTIDYRIRWQRNKDRGEE